MGWCLRPDERGRDARPGSNPGILVVSPKGAKYFFPGSTQELAMTLAKLALGDRLESPAVQIEYGEKPEGGNFVQQFVIREAVK